MTTNGTCDTASSHLSGSAARAIYNPFAPITGSRWMAGARSRQRSRRSEIRAAIRRMLATKGCEHVTVREVAGISGFAVQTIYNLVGPRNDAISDAISEYSIFVGRTALRRADDPMAVAGIVDRWIDSVAVNSEFARQSNLIFFTDSRDIYYRFRDQQLIGMRNLMQRQKSCGVIRSEVDSAALAESIVISMSALWIDWADRSQPIETLRTRLRAGVSMLMSGKLHPRYEETLAEWYHSDRTLGSAIAGQDAT
jgi:AcrR family transcriptional regulator